MFGLITILCIFVSATTWLTTAIYMDKWSHNDKHKFAPSKPFGHIDIKYIKTLILRWIMSAINRNLQANESSWIDGGQSKGLRHISANLNTN